MQFTAILLLAAVLQVSATSTAQTVTYKAKSEPLINVLSAIRDQTGYVFFYGKDDLKDAKKVTVSLKDADVNTALQEVLKGQPLRFIIRGNTIVISKRKSPSTLDPLNNDQFPITGIVRNENGETMPGVNIVIKGTTKGVISDNTGSFSLDANPGEILVFSSIGYGAKEVKISGENSIQIVLERLSSPLDEVQIIAYGQTSKRLNTGNTATVKAVEISKQPVANPLLSLQGRVPGLFVTQSNGVPGSGVTVRIQGQNSLIRGNDPLYVVDGVPYISQLLPSVNAILGSSGDLQTGANGNPLSYLNPADIESIDILKDADATAIYGSRAANGAILITTKKGKAGKTQLDVNAQTGWGKVTRRLNLMNTRQYLELRREAFKNDELPVPTATDAPDFSNYDFTVWDSTRNTDWQKELIGSTARYTDVQGSLSGGSINTQFLVSGGYHKETTVFPGDFNDRKGSLHFNINHLSTDGKFNFQLSGNYQVDRNSLLQADLTDAARNLPPNSPKPFNSDGSLNWEPVTEGDFGTWTNPYANTFSHFQSDVSNLVANSLVSYKILSNLQIKSSFGYTSLQQNDFAGVPQMTFDPALWPILGNSLRTARYVNNAVKSWIIEPQVQYNAFIAKGKLDVLIGTTLSDRNSDGETLEGKTYNSDAVLENRRAAANVTVASAIQARYRYNAVFGRINYNWQDKYVVSLTGRRDGTSRFGSENYFHNFGSVGGAWIFSNENFIHNTIPALSFGKLKGSFGTTGNEQINDYLFLNLYEQTGAQVPYLGVPGLVVNRLANPYLQWEETKKLQLGLDLAFLHDRIYFSGAWFRNRSSNQLLSYALPGTTGFPSIEANFPATVENAGFELSLNTNNIKNRNFSWNTGINITFLKNKLVSFPGLESSAYFDTYIVGQPITITRVYQFSDVNPQTGMYEFINAGKQVASSLDYNTDRTAVVNTAPRFYGGFQNSFTYKGFELSLLFQFVKQTGKDYQFGNYPGASSFNQSVYLLDRWRQPGDVSGRQRVNTNYMYAEQFDYANASSAAYSDASFIRLKNMSLSWQMPEQWVKGLKFDRIRLYIQGQNLLTITKYKGLDPENMSISSLPPLRVITTGLQFTL